MDKKLVSLYVPAVQERFDLMVPMELEIGMLTSLLTDGVRELCKGRFAPSGQETLSLRQSTALLDPGRTLSDYGVEDGAQLVLV